jgi:hypothetical protein
MTTRLEPVWRYPVLTARGEAIERMARAMWNGKAWPAVFSPKAAEQLAEDALSALEAAAPAPEGMREAIADLIRDAESDIYWSCEKGREFDSAKLIDAILALLAAKGEGR